MGKSNDGGHAPRVRAALARFAPGDEMTLTELIDRIEGYIVRRRVTEALRDMVRRGEIERLDRGRYRRPDPPVPAGGSRHAPPELARALWDALRAERVATVDDLRMLTGASEPYVREWLRALQTRGTVRQEPGGRWRLVHDPVEMPRLTDNAEKLRRIRERRKETRNALEALNVAVRNLIDETETQP